jgi:pimeloyl-ACP methyl ester carboxylesterase
MRAGETAMSFFEKGAVRIHYEEAGSGFPLLLIAGGGLNSNISGITGDYPPFNAIKEFGDENRCIAYDLRNAPPGQSSGPLEIDRPWDSHTDDQLALMDHLGFKKFMVLGFCIGGPLIWNLLKRAPDRVVAGVLAMPSGSRPEMRDWFYDNNMKGWAPELTKRRPDIAMEQAEKFLTRMYRTDPDFVFTVTRDFVRLPDAGPDPARRYPRASLRGRDGERATGAERGSEFVSMEGAERARAARGASDPVIPPRASASAIVRRMGRAKRNPSFPCAEA